jgi:23S rRNA pseudouridine1911/1915/1917 synthase
MEDEEIVLQVEAGDGGSRLDRFVAARVPALSRSFIRQLIDGEDLTVNARPAKASYAVRVGDQIALQVPPATPSELIAEPIPLTVVYEDDDVVVIDKAAGMVVHPAPGHPSGTLVNALLYRYPAMRIANDLRPGIVHRLDQGTSGLMVVARNDRAMQHLAEQQRQRSMTKIYLAVVEGPFKHESGTIDAPIGRHPVDRKRMAVVPEGRAARTHYRALEALGDYTLLELRLETGRTHQIRVHLQHIQRPVLGDPLYNSKRSKPSFGLARQFLHAHRLGFALPSNNEPREWSAALPEELSVVLHKLRQINNFK